MSIQDYFPRGHFWDNFLSVANAWKRLGYFPNIISPRSFNELILSQKWKFDGNMDLAKRLTDKAEVKSWLSDIGMAHLSIPTIGLFESVNEVAMATFDGEIIAKSTHGSGAVIIRKAKDNNPFTNDDLASMEGWLKEDYYIRSREPNYKGLEKRIIVEPLLRDDSGFLPKDYKVFCIKGKPFAIQVDLGRFEKHTRQIYRPDWTLLPYSMCYPRNDTPLAIPGLLDEALDVAKLMSSNFGFLRVDFFFIDGTLKLGELTFFPGNGAERFHPEEGDFLLPQYS